MVNTLLILLTSVLFINTANAITPAELRKITGQAEHAQHIRAKRIKANDPSSMIKGLKTTPAKQPKPANNKNNNNKQTTRSPEAQTNPPVTSRKHTPGTNIHPGQPAGNTLPMATRHRAVYIPPAKPKTSKTLTTDAVKLKQSHYGIRLGTWMLASLNRKTNSAEPGLIELTLTQDIDGDLRTLETGTQFFAKAVYNDGSKRMDLKIKKAITPDGKEIKLNGIVFDDNKVAGLSGHIPQITTQQSIESGLAKGTLAASGELINTATGNDVLGVFMTEAGDSVLEDKRDQYTQRKPRKVIFVSPQTLIIRVEASF